MAKQKPAPGANGTPTSNGQLPRARWDALPQSGFRDPVATNRVASALGGLVENATSLSRLSLQTELGDPRRSVDDECGYPPAGEGIPVELYKRLYDRCDVANRVVQLMPRECWKVNPLVYEDSAAETSTQFELDWDGLGAMLADGQSWHAEEEGSAVWGELMRADILSRIGSFGLILMGLDDGKNLQEPVDGLVTVNWQRESVKKMVVNAAGQQVERVVAVRHHSPTYTPVMPDGVANRQDVERALQPRRVWRGFDRKEKKHAYDAVTPPPLSNEEQLAVNRWAAEALLGGQVRKLIQRGNLAEACSLVDNAQYADEDGGRMPWQALGLTANERQSLAVEKHQLVLNALAANAPSFAQSTGSNQPPDPRTQSQFQQPSLPPARLGQPPQPPQQALPQGQRPQPKPQNVRGDGGPTSALEPNDTFPPNIGNPPAQTQGPQPQQPVQRPEQGFGPSLQDKGAQPTGEPKFGSVPPGRGEQPQQPNVSGTDRQYGNSDGAMSSGYGMTPASYAAPVPGGGQGGRYSNQPATQHSGQGPVTEDTQLGPKGSSGQGVFGGRTAGTDQQYYGVQLGPSELPATAPARQKRRIIFLNCYDESLVQVVRYEWNVNNPRFGMPVMYRVTLNDPREVHSGIGLPLATVFVHWSRVIHVNDRHSIAGSSKIFSPPAMRPVLNRCLDLYKLPAAAAEGYWQSGTPTRVFETHPQLGGDVLLDRQAILDEVENLLNTLQKALIGKGGSWKLLAPSMVDPSPFIQTQIEMICICLGVPVRIFKGAERGELASSQDDGNWNDRVKGRMDGYLTPRLVCPLIDRLIMYGVLSQPKQYFVEWPDLESLNEKDKATVFQIVVTTIVQYISGGGEALIPPRELLTKFLKMSEEDADVILSAAQEAQEEQLQQQAAQAQMQAEAAGVQMDAHGQIQDAADQVGLKPETPEGYVDPEQQDHDRQVELLRAKNPGMGGGGGAPPFGGKSGGPPGKGGPPTPGGPPGAAGAGKMGVGPAGKGGGPGLIPMKGVAPPPKPGAPAPVSPQDAKVASTAKAGAMHDPTQPEVAPAIQGRSANNQGLNLTANSLALLEEADVLLNFIADQPRDDGGRWSGGGDSGERHASRHDSGYTYANPDDRDSDDQHIDRERQKASADHAKALADVVRIKSQLEEHGKRYEGVTKSLRDASAKEEERIASELRDKLQKIKDSHDAHEAKSSSREARRSERMAKMKAELMKINGNQ